jgi:hypothetical protein
MEYIRVGSNPTVPIFCLMFKNKKPPHSSVVEQKTVMVISYLLVTGSNPVEEKPARMAKWISREASNLKIRGSSPRMGFFVLKQKDKNKTIIKNI